MMDKIAREMAGERMVSDATAIQMQEDKPTKSGMQLNDTHLTAVHMAMPHHLSCARHTFAWMLNMT